MTHAIKASLDNGKVVRPIEKGCSLFCFNDNAENYYPILNASPTLAGIRLTF